MKLESEFKDFLKEFDPLDRINIYDQRIVRHLWTALRLGGLEPRANTARYINHPKTMHDLMEDNET